MHYLIFGGAGFVGANLARSFSLNGDKVTCVDNLVRRGSEVNLNDLRSMGVDFIHADIRNKEDLDGLPQSDIVLNCAAQPSAVNYANPEFDYTNNTAGQVNILEFCRIRNIPIILWSTNKVYPYEVTNAIPYEREGDRFVWKDDQPPYLSEQLIGWEQYGFNENASISGGDHSIYGASKAAADVITQEWCNAYKIPGIVNRFSCLSGPNQWGKAEQGWVAWFAIAHELGLPIDIFGYKGLQVRDNLYISDVAELIQKQADVLVNADAVPYGEVYNVGGGSGEGFSISLNEAMKMIEEMRGSEFNQVTYHNDTRRADQAIYISDITKVRETFDWKPTVTVKEGYERIFEWIDRNKKTLQELYNG